MKKTNIVILSAAILNLLCICASYADTKEFVFPKDQMPDYLFYVGSEGVCDKCSKKTRSMVSIIQHIKNQEAKYWFRNKYQDEYNIEQVTIKRIERSFTSVCGRAYGSFRGGFGFDRTPKKRLCKSTEITWVVFEMTYKPKISTSIINTIINSSSNANIVSFS